MFCALIELYLHNVSRTCALMGNFSVVRIQERFTSLTELGMFRLGSELGLGLELGSELGLGPGSGVY